MTPVFNSFYLRCTDGKGDFPKKFSPDIFNHFPKRSGEVNDFLLVSEDFLKISADYLMVIGSVFHRSHLLIRLPRSLEYFGESLHLDQKYVSNSDHQFKFLYLQLAR